MRSLLVIFFLFIVMPLAGCQGQAIVMDSMNYVDGRTQEEMYHFERAYVDNTQMEVELPQLEHNSNTSQRDDHTHSLAIALQEYFDGGLDVPDYWGVPSTSAFLIDTDGKGTKGVLAIRHENTDDYYMVIFPFARVFYLYNGDIYYMDFGHAGFSSVMGILENNRLVMFSGDGGAKSYTLFRIENGVLIEDFVIYTMMYEDFYYIPSGMWERREAITEKEFNAIRLEYGLHSTRSLVEDDAEFILERLRL